MAKMMLLLLAASILGQVTSQGRAGTTNCFVGDGDNYKGTVSRSAVGDYECRRWDQPTTPDQRATIKDPKTFIDGSVSAAGNNCRNPGGLGVAPWCYIITSSANGSGWKYCGVNRCEPSKKNRQSECYIGDGSSYKGTLQKTRSGYRCAGGTICRNKNSEKKRPYCKVSGQSVSWEYCDIPRCADDVKTPRAMRGCGGECGKHAGSDFYWCELYKKGSLWNGARKYQLWDYCCPKPGYTHRGTKCTGPCELKNEEYDPEWRCNTAEKDPEGGHRWGWCCDGTAKQDRYIEN